MRIAFDVQHLYYLPQFLPVFRELDARGVECLFVFHEEFEDAVSLDALLTTHKLPHLRVPNAAAAHDEYIAHPPDWIVFGNGYGRLDELSAKTRTALLYHGIGVKQCYYDAELMAMDVRFVEGEYRQRELMQRYPDATMKATGFAKLDPLFDADESQPALDIAKLGLDPSRPTILYAPTYYPSSIECLPADLPARLAGCNLIVKPHHFTFTKKRYRHQLERLRQWNRYENVWLSSVADVSLLPMMASADLLVSEASSALFEFAALDKPVVWCDFYYRRWNHRGPLGFRLDRRLDRTIEKYRDIAAHAKSPEELPEVVAAELADPGRLSAIRRTYTRELIGATDGKSARRIADFLIGS